MFNEKVNIIARQDSLDLHKKAIYVLHYGNHFYYVTKKNAFPDIDPYANYDQIFKDLYKPKVYNKLRFSLENLNLDVKSL